ncbi:family 43 glycosylhydrolase [Humibacter soli]
MGAPIYHDPVYDGATDPTLIQNSDTGHWWMFYTQRRTTDGGARHRWVHGTEIGIAVSTDRGATWAYRGVAGGLEQGNTLWAPEVIRAASDYRMYLTVVDGVPDDWADAEAHIVEYRSDDLQNWTRMHALDLGSDRVIDAAVARGPDGMWRLWYKNERDRSSTWVATSSDLDTWSVEGRAIPATPPHEGPNVFLLDGWWWLITDEWRGLGVHRSTDAVHWRRQERDGGLILDKPGSHPEDRELGHHADAVCIPDANGSVAALFYFTHPQRSRAMPNEYRARVSAVHVARLTVRNGDLLADRDVSGIPLQFEGEPQ